MTGENIRKLENVQVDIVERLEVHLGTPPLRGRVGILQEDANIKSRR
jgi:hypothetical protein